MAKCSINRVYLTAHFDYRSARIICVVVLLLLFEKPNRSLAPPPPPYNTATTTTYGVCVCIHSKHAARPRNSYDVIRPGGRTIWRGSGRSPVHPVGHILETLSTSTNSGGRPRLEPGPGPSGGPVNRTMCVRLQHPMAAAATVVVVYR